LQFLINTIPAPLAIVGKPIMASADDLESQRLRALGKMGVATVALNIQRVDGEALMDIEARERISPQ
jgi:hypothetical protein